MIKASRNDWHEEIFDQISKPYERKYRIKMREIFDQQLDDVIEHLQQFKHIKEFEDVLVDWSKYRIIYNEFGQLMLPFIIEAMAELEIEFWELGISFDVLDPNVQNSIIRRINRFSDAVINETRDQLHAVISESIQAGDGIPQLEKKIRALYKDMSKYRAVRIARTEVIWAQNEGAEQSYIQSGVVKEKEWWTARDDRRCEWCSEMHGKRITIGENYFELGQEMTLANGKKMKFDYENISHPPLHPHCRCVLIPIVEL